MTHDTPTHWDTREFDRPEHRRSTVRTLVGAELPETRIFIDQLYHELTASGRRIQTDRLVQNKDNSPWFRLTHGEDITGP